MGSHDAGAAAKWAFTLSWSPTGAAQAAPCRQDAGGTGAKRSSKGDGRLLVSAACA